MLASVIDTKALLDVIVASLIAGVGVTIAFSLVILGFTRRADLREAGRGAAASAYLALAVLALAGFGAGVVYGISVMASK